MKVFSTLRAMALILSVLAGFCLRAEAQSFAVSVTPSANSVPVNSTLTYTIVITNLLPSSDLFAVSITNAFSTNTVILSATNSHPSGVTVTNPNSVVFIFSTLPFNVPVAQMQLSVQPTVAGAFTNVFSVRVGTPADFLTTNIVTTVTGGGGGTNAQADLAVSIQPPPADNFVNDVIFFNVTVTNLGPGTASGVVLSNSVVPSNVKFPANGRTNISVGTMNSLTGQTFLVGVQPTNAAPLSFSVTATSTTTDPNLTNNTATITNVVVGSFLTNRMEVLLVSTQLLFNPENSLMEQRIQLSNASPDVVESARVIVSGFGPTNRLANAVGTNDGKPFVVHGAPLNPNESVGLLLLYKVPTHQQFPLNPSNLVARAVTAADLSPPANPGTLVATNRIANVNGAIYIEFASTNGRTYTVVYSDDILFTNPKVARPNTVAPANWTYFIDYGPPETVSAPTNSTSRFYRIYQNP